MNICLVFAGKQIAILDSWRENLIILVIYFTYLVNPFIACSGISQLREFP